MRTSLSLIIWGGGIKDFVFISVCSFSISFSKLDLSVYKDFNSFIKESLAWDNNFILV